jgi:hypothetical protein
MSLVMCSRSRQIWTGPHLQYRISALGQVASDSIDVAEDYVRLKVFLPWLLAKLAETLQPLIRNEGTLLLHRVAEAPAGGRKCYRRSLRPFEICSSSSA